ncbi:hypothetical protein KKF34_14265 [Myxococcota bacterium]|nr:hypothetical protein [Myxococcota bacterium]MBU1380734.1 hypothetical protein [Myxococcota bacterium]MBU1498038.1 hypothetical protein [Myxococcota bacterium]
MKNICYLLTLFIFTMGCSKKGGMSDSSDDKKKACRKLFTESQKEQYPLVQSPALATVTTKKGGIPAPAVSASSDVIVGVNIKSLTKLPVYKTVLQTIPEAKSYINYAGFIGLDPGNGVESIVGGVTFTKTNKIISDYQLSVRGNADAKSILEKVGGLSSMLSSRGINLTKSDSSLKVTWQNYTVFASSSSDTMNLSSQNSLKDPVTSNAAYTAMKNKIPADTTLWMILLRKPQFPIDIPKVLKPVYDSIEMASGYMNSDDQGNVEAQFRLKMKNPESARQLKELANLGLSRLLQKLGPKVGRSISLDNMGTHKNIVSRGQYVRLLLRLDRFQAQHVMNFIKKQIAANTHWIPGENIGIN